MKYLLYALLVVLPVAAQFRPLPVFAQAGDLGLPNTPMGYLGLITQEITADKTKELKLRAVRGVPNHRRRTGAGVCRQAGISQKLSVRAGSGCREHGGKKYRCVQVSRAPVRNC